MSTLVVSATKAEAVHVPSGLQVIITGVGKVAAASAVSRALAADASIDHVVNIGSCGALRDGLRGIFEVGKVLNHDFSADAIRALGYEVEDELELGGSDIVCATGDLFVTDTVVRAELAERAHVVDMEAYAVAWAAREAGVSARIVKHVSDNADETALDWASVVDASARDLADWLRTNVL
ncbi:adenosylhomocysteine nucleosidase [Nocardioides albertanoniae]|uniref:Adenosylhomocysteine nucleosidase n=1 Tax=Nocardioides albertanoniae TaxID=1175486 RepID=A0A543A6T2_9ACTN|nr:nucleosidase [Nocardioides albertanoniae]TQL68230.1 adenosylhomocysteine nucleosidase [Nocardioides albertanoniae]